MIDLLIDCHGVGQLRRVAPRRRHFTFRPPSDHRPNVARDLEVAEESTERLRQNPSDRWQFTVTVLPDRWGTFSCGELSPGRPRPLASPPQLVAAGRNVPLAPLANHADRSPGKENNIAIAEASSNTATVSGLWRYPVKSMQGEELNATEVTERGTVGDRAYALLDRETGKVASAKNPRKWARLFDFRARYVEPPSAGAPLPPVRITLPDGTLTTSSDANVNAVLSEAIGRQVILASPSPDAPRRSRSTGRTSRVWPAATK